jgi:hypothetical protein
MLALVLVLKNSSASSPFSSVASWNKSTMFDSCKHVSSFGRACASLHEHHKEVRHVPVRLWPRWSKWECVQWRSQICSPSFPEPWQGMSQYRSKKGSNNASKGNAKKTINTFNHVHATSCAAAVTPRSTNIQSWFLTCACKYVTVQLGWELTLSSRMFLSLVCYLSR